MKALPKGQYSKHIRYGLGVITESGEQRAYSDEGNQCSGLIVISIPGWCDQSSERSDAGFCIL
jgi:hypothetical protein